MRSVEPLTSVPDLERSSAEEVLEYLVDQFHPRLYVACSFQKEASVIMDMLLKIEPEARFFTLDTGVLFPETYETWRKLEQRYGAKVDVYQGMSLARQRQLHGDELWNREPDACCGIRKVEPLGRALAGKKAWVTGQRRAQSSTRAGLAAEEDDAAHGMTKFNPLANWSEQDVWDYIRANGVPYNALHDRGFPSIGCAPCTREVQPGEDVRAGRWWWENPDSKECGLHMVDGKLIRIKSVAA
jgi:phosphoadenosine phosphosulfate reductase